MILLQLMTETSVWWHFFVIFLNKQNAYPLARPTTSFFSSQCWPCLYSPLSSTALLSPLVKNLMSPFSLWTQNQWDYGPHWKSTSLVSIRLCSDAHSYTWQVWNIWQLWAFWNNLSLQFNTMNSLINKHRTLKAQLNLGQQCHECVIHTFHGSLVLCVLLGSLCLLSWRQQSLQLWWGPLPGWSGTGGLLCGKLAPCYHWKSWRVRMVKIRITDIFWQKA